MKYSKTTGGFYDPKVNTAIPDDAVEIDKATHAALLAGLDECKSIVGDENGFPVLADPPPADPSDAIKAQIAELESSITARRLREAVLGTDGGWLADVDRQISALRTKLSQPS